MQLLNFVLRSVLDLLLTPFAGVPAWVSLVVWSALSAVLFLVVYKRFSDQTAIAAAKDRMMAALFEMSLFRDDLRSLFRAQGELLWTNLRYLSLNIKPILVLIVPFVIVMGHLHLQYGWQGLEQGESSLLVARLAEEPDQRPDLELETPAEVVAETEATWIPSRREAVWRLHGTGNGRFLVNVKVASESGSNNEASKLVVVSDRLERRSIRRHRGGLFDQLLDPGEDPLPKDSPFEELRIEYQPAGENIVGAPRWMVVYFVLTLVFAFAFRKRMDVTF